MDQANSSTAPTPSSHSSIKNFQAWVLGWLPIGLGLAVWMASAFNLTGWFEIGKIFGIFTAMAIGVVIHELAHFVVGRALGRKPWCLRIGHGEVVFDKEFHSFRLILQSLPYSGAVYPYLHGTRSTQFASVFAGPFSNLILFMIFFLVVTQTTEPPPFTSFSMQMLLANGYLLLVSLVPHYARTTGNANDGMLMWHALRGTFPKYQPRSNTNRHISPSWSWMIKNHSWELLLTGYREQLNNPALPAEQRILLLDAFATCVLMAGANEYLAEADRFSRELLQLDPDALTSKGTRGSILVEKGDLQTGIEMLEEVMERDENKFDRSIASSYLALAKWQQGNHTEALKWLATAREIDPQCASTIRIGTLLESKTIPTNS